MGQILPGPPWSAKIYWMEDRHTSFQLFSEWAVPGPYVSILENCCLIYKTLRRESKSSTVISIVESIQQYVGVAAILMEILGIYCIQFVTSSLQPAPSKMVKTCLHPLLRTGVHARMCGYHQQCSLFWGCRGRLHHIPSDMPHTSGLSEGRLRDTRGRGFARDVFHQSWICTGELIWEGDAKLVTRTLLTDIPHIECHFPLEAMQKRQGHKLLKRNDTKRRENSRRILPM